jgi:hypothetical protein
MHGIIAQVVDICGGIGTIATAVILLVRPVRERVLGTKQIRDGQRCQLRSDMLHTYYKHREEETIRQYEYENFLMEYQAYKALKGNSFIDGIAEKVKSWEVVS